MAKLITEPHRFSYIDWKVSNKAKFKNAELERQFAERLVAESKRLVDETDELKTIKEDVEKKLDQRVWDVTFWKDELEKKLTEFADEIAATDANETKLNAAIETMGNPLHIIQNVLLNREKRRGIELVHDDVQIELLKELDIVNGVNELLVKTQAELKEQNRLNRKNKFYIEKDLKDKFSAKSVDQHCLQLNTLSSGLESDDCSNLINPNSVTAEEWQQLSHDMVEKAEAERQNAIKLRSFVETILQQAHCDLTRQKEKTDLAFEKRIRETKEAKAKLEDHLNQVLSQIREMDENVDRLEKAICEKEPHLKLAKARLTHREQRPNTELCRDPAQYRLINEVAQVEDGVNKLKSALGVTQDIIKGLRRRQLELEEDIENKANTLFIDEVENMGMRQSLVYQPW